MSFDIIENPAAKHYCSDEIVNGQWDNYPVGTILRCTTCGQFWKAHIRITVTRHTADGEETRNVPQWRRLYWRTVWARYKEYMYG